MDLEEKTKQKAKIPTAIRLFQILVKKKNERIQVIIWIDYEIIKANMGRDIFNTNKSPKKNNLSLQVYLELLCFSDFKNAEKITSRYVETEDNRRW